MKYIGFLPDKKSITKDSLEELIMVPHIEYILTEDIPEKCVPQWAGWPKYSIINSDGSNRILKLGKYEVIDMDYADAALLKGRMVTIMEEGTMQSHTFKIGRPWHHFFCEELLPLLDELNQVGNLKQFVKYKNNEELLKKYEAKLIEQEKLISTLTTKVETYEKENDGPISLDK